MNEYTHFVKYFSSFGKEDDALRKIMFSED
jgi:hypothetical protein